MHTVRVPLTDELLIDFDGLQAGTDTTHAYAAALQSAESGRAYLAAGRAGTFDGDLFGEQCAAYFR